MMSLEDQGYTLVEIPYLSWTRKLERWLWENTKADFETEAGYAIETFPDGLIPVTPYRVWFESSDDAVRFKLTFAGAQ